MSMRFGKTTVKNFARIFAHNPRLLTRNPYLNFLRNFKRNHANYDCDKILREGAIAWRDLTDRQKEKWTQKQVLKRMRLAIVQHKNPCRRVSSANRRKNIKCSRHGFPRLPIYTKRKPRSLQAIKNIKRLTAKKRAPVKRLARMNGRQNVSARKRAPVKLAARMKYLSARKRAPVKLAARMKYRQSLSARKRAPVKLAARMKYRQSLSARKRVPVKFAARTKCRQGLSAKKRSPIKPSARRFPSISSRCIDACEPKCIRKRSVAGKRTFPLKRGGTFSQYRQIVFDKIRNPENAIFDAIACADACESEIRSSKRGASGVIIAKKRKLLKGTKMKSKAYTRKLARTTIKTKKNNGIKITRKLKKVRKHLGNNVMPLPIRNSKQKTAKSKTKNSVKKRRTTERT